MSETIGAPAGSGAIEARRSRLERLGAYSERDRANEAYRRNTLAARLRERLPIDRQYRALARVYREAVAIDNRADTLCFRRQEILRRRYKAIAYRVQAAHKIKPPGKAPSSHHRYRDQMNEALWTDPEYRALKERESRVDGRIAAIRSRIRHERICAGVLAMDGRETRRAKVAMYRERRET
jgi:hypothetical protein